MVARSTPDRKVGGSIPSRFILVFAIFHIPFSVVFFQNELMCPQKRIALDAKFGYQIRVYYTFQFFIFALGFLRRSSLK